MKISIPTSVLTVFGLLALLMPSNLLATESTEPLEGWLSILWGDVRPGDDPASYRKLILTEDDGKDVLLSMSEPLLRGNVLRWNGQRVKVYPTSQGDVLTKDGKLRVAAVQLLGDASAAVTNSQPWISILCKFADVSDEPRDLAYFRDMYGNSPGRLDHYWREVSANNIDIVGSIAVDWVNLPGTQASYAPTPGSGSNANLSQIFNDCTAAVDPMVDFSQGGTPFAGINLMINDLLDCCAWGGGRFATLDGITKVWRVTWNPPWAFRNEAVIAHEMGHGFGLPHANNWDGDGNPYDSPWDVMSSTSGYATRDPTYGPLGKHINAYHKDRLGWLASAKRFEAQPNRRHALELDHTAYSGGTNYQMIRIPIDANRWYTVEARLRSGDYEAALVGDAVIIHEVDVNRSEPAWAVDGDMPPANYGDNPGTMWTVGETFTDAANQISVTVDYATPTGFGVTVIVGEAGIILEDNFEVGDLESWTIAVP